MTTKAELQNEIQTLREKLAGIETKNMATISMSKAFRVRVEGYADVSLLANTGVFATSEDLTEAIEHFCEIGFLEAISLELVPEEEEEDDT